MKETLDGCVSASADSLAASKTEGDKQNIAELLNWVNRNMEDLEGGNVGVPGSLSAWEAVQKIYIIAIHTVGPLE